MLDQLGQMVAIARDIDARQVDQRQRQSDADNSLEHHLWCRPDADRQKHLRARFKTVDGIGVRLSLSRVMGDPLLAGRLAPTQRLRSIPRMLRLNRSLWTRRQHLLGRRIQSQGNDRQQGLS